MAECVPPVDRSLARPVMRAGNNPRELATLLAPLAIRGASSPPVIAAAAKAFPAAACMEIAPIASIRDSARRMSRPAKPMA